MSTPAPTLAIIVVAYQSGEDVLALIDSLTQHPAAIPCEIHVLDNASPDGSGTQLAAALDSKDDVRVHQLEANLGFGAACNRGAEATDATYLCFLNPDCLVLDNALDAACELLATSPAIGVVGLRVYRPDGTLEPTARSFPDPWSGVAGRKSLLRRLWPKNPLSRRFLLADQVASGASQPVDWVAGTALVVRRADFLQLGGFDPAFFLYWEDADLCKRYHDQLLLGTRYLAAGAIRHQGDGSASKAKPFAIRQFHRAAFTYVCRYLAPSPWHPLRWFAWCALRLRQMLLLARSTRTP